MLALAGSAGAADVRERGAGAVPGLVENEGTALNMFNLRNPAGLGMLARENRVDFGMAASFASEKETAPDYTSTITDNSFGLGPSAGAYQGLTYWITDNDALRVSTGLETAGRKATSDPKTAFEDDQNYSILDYNFELHYARKLTENLFVGLGVRPIMGSAEMPSASGYTVEEISYGMLDYNVGMAFRMRTAEGTDFSAGVNYQPYNDTTRIVDLISTNILDVMTTGDVGGYTLKYKAKQSAVSGKTKGSITPSGSILGAQAAVERENLLQAGIFIDRTAAQVESKNEFDGPYGYHSETSGVSQRVERIRYGLGGKYLADLGGGNGIRLAASFASGSAKTEALNYPKTESVRAEVERFPYETLFGISFQGRNFGVGMGAEMTGERNVSTFKDSPGDKSERSDSFRAFRTGGEYRFDERWTARLGLSFGIDQVDEDDPDKPKPGEEGNPQLKDTALSLGGSYNLDNKLRVDVAGIFHSLSQEPEQDEPEIDRSLIEFLAGVKYAF